MSLRGWYLVWVVSAFVLTLAAAAGIAHIRKQKTPTGKLAFVAAGLGGASLVLPVLVASTY